MHYFCHHSQTLSIQDFFFFLWKIWGWWVKILVGFGCRMEGKTGASDYWFKQNPYVAADWLGGCVCSAYEGGALKGPQAWKQRVKQ